MNHQSFANSIEQLLRGEIIDIWMDKSLYTDLCQSDNLDEVNAYLSRLNRMCIRSNDGNGFYCAYLNIDHPEIQKTIQRQFNEFVSKIEAIVQWMRLCRTLTNDSKPIEYGDVISKGQLLINVEQSQLGSEQLKKLAQKLGKQSTSTNASDQLQFVLNYLQEEKYLILAGHDAGTTYRATAKWSLFYEQLEYISACEQIPADNLHGETGQSIQDELI
ncbi:hypothetical protein [Acinetobacter guillouiae]|uniref:Uncharacterized protein n=1 Tax=Acinetobacter guillouiae NIPH 991 TaxID=1217656 RepID=N8Y4C3_ACIGI|nr:hypothetical protein [Acinetobacter guillouiae]ENV16179.1 hypothetical protein F964_03114 [Acinetobacter guillouiae NIPH 991]